MRKTSQDGGEYSATSVVENEVKKPKGLLSELKTKKIGKRTAPNLSEESDDAVVEPLLQKSTNSAVQSAKYFAKAKADTVKEITKLFNDKKTQHASTSGFGTTETLLSDKDQADSKTNVCNVPLHNHMNTNVFHSLSQSDDKVNGTTKTQVLVEIDGSKQSGFNPGPLIFTTAKIHTDGKPNHMDPVQMTPAPILSTVEVSVSKGGHITSDEKKISNGTSIMNISFSQPLKPETAENTTNFSTTVKAQNSLSKFDNSYKPLSTNNTKENKTITAANKTDKTQLNYPLKTDSLSSMSQLNTAANVNIPVVTNSKDGNKVLSEPSISEMQKSNIVVKTTESLLEENTKAVESSAQLPFITQTHKKEKPNTIDSDSKSKNIDRDSKENESLIAINIKPIVIDKQTSSSKKPSERQKNIANAEELFEIETKMASAKNPECLTDSGAKSSSSTNIPTQSKVNEKKYNTDTYISQKSSTNEQAKFNSKESVNLANAPKESSIYPRIVKPVHDPLLPAVESSMIKDTSKSASLNTNTSVTDTIHSTDNKIQAKDSKIMPLTTDTASSNTDKTKDIITRAPTSMNEKTISNSNKNQAITATSTTDTGSSNTDKTKPTLLKGQTLMAERASSKANKIQAVTATSVANKPSSKTDKTQTIPIKAPTSIPDKASSNANKTKAISSKVANSIADRASTSANKTQAVTTTSIADKANSKTDKTQTIPTKAPTPISDKASSNATKTQAANSIGDKTGSNTTQTIPTKAPTPISDKASSNATKTQAANSIGDKTGSNTYKSQPVTSKTATSIGNTTSSKANKTISTKIATPTNAKPTTATSTKSMSVSTVSKTSTNSPPSTTASTKMAQITSPGSTTAKPLVEKTAKVSTSITNPTGITSTQTVTAEHSNKIKTNESSNKIGSKSSDQTKDVKVTKA